MSLRASSLTGQHAPPQFGRTPTSISSRGAPYAAYKSPFAPAYKTAPHWHGITLKTAVKYGTLLGGFGGVAGIFALFFFAEVPRVRDDIILKIPFLEPFFKKEIAPEDNPF
ncbi:uncharacterized protein EI97DRAFT_407323 [Westerdykella ornata]|uniref:Uncharacterized protein n=1 Tax=Westerdykella ornata TaxID=318751 RepID=A0A6A6J9M4_WESOR|nr:uncharacterized protein EI97DRAFT_407323 [Westerdykella ornata]KAF2271939.1 hypothetical protein EI97DRAFT_407323 [Westerdykella ornata]